MSDTTTDQRADRIAVHATGVGIGLISFMVTWIIAARITERMLDTPTNAYVAMVVALGTGAVVAVVASRRLGRTDASSCRTHASGRATSQNPASRDGWQAGL